MSFGNYRTSRPTPSFGPRTGSGKKKEYLDSWKPTVEPQWVKFVRGIYANCDVCQGNVQPDIATFDPATGLVQYTCANIKYEANQPKRNGNAFARCDHKGAVPLNETTPYCETYSAFLPGVGPRGMVVNSNNLNGKRANIPDLLYHYASIDDQIKIRAAYAHTVVVSGTYHTVMERSQRGNDYTKEVLCDGPQCAHCAGGLPVHEGAARSYSPGYNHWNNLAQFNERIGETCVSCRTGSVVPVMYLCTNPQCQQAINDLSSADPVSAISAYREVCRMLGDKDNKSNPGKIECPFCRTWVVPEEVTECKRIEWNRRGDAVTSVVEGCGAPARMSIFDCEVQLAKSSTENTADLLLVTFDPTAPLTEEQAARVRPNDFMDATDITPERQSEKMKRPNIFYTEAARSSQGVVRNPAASANPAAGARGTGGVNYTRR